MASPLPPPTSPLPSPLLPPGLPPSPLIDPTASPGLPTKRKVVLPEGLSGHHTIPHHADPWHQWEGFVVLLVLLHIAVMGFYAWVLWRDKRDRRDRRRGPAAVREAAGARAKVGSPGAAVRGMWRTPKDILQKEQKERLGKA